jgi:sortase (surface protein transpeptidase)
MSSDLPRPVRGTGVIGVLVVLAALPPPLVQPARTPITPGPSRTAVAIPPTAPHGSAGWSAQTSSPRPGPTALPRSVPVRLSIPTIDARSTLIPLNLNPDHTVQVPPLTNPAQAGWYAPGPTPGETGASVILGHVDGYDEPGIFYHLRDLHPGNAILITRKDATTTRFTVYRTEQAPKTDFPTTKVYGPTTRPELRLITCGGTFDRQTGNYLDNIIVFAALTGAS